MSVAEEIRNFVVDNFLFGDEAGLTDDSSFIREGIVDSTGILQLVTYLQERYQIAVDDEELTPENLDSVRRVAAFVEVKRGRAAVAGA
ncbi:acyl carrier protein [Geomonas ferrireducens]|uniref:acyl carrier protein n=1 Tax=Geomonas ferrireducens TaxID=2570227 RepID=UPI0010A79418|nr:acyl carrier protein [Geomonas ferrireducens]